ncbi:protein kinase [Parafrankia sp. EUN1f]|uniref:protein kinase domain-containing protein n=1 Tax=Parafrankia sp. EUN1f TaxID=102897 RepID=UPI0001C468B7|nr:protein kinase [Parafrankia sp. EUN1f]EFC80501.1 serine/threonine protein kinase [Parafrankia sp. EUN1f]
MEYVPSVSLAEALHTRGAFPADEVIRIGVAALDALVAAHQRGINHRDVKPANILIGHDGRIVLVDFGVASHGSDPTITDGPIGTLAYIAPEQFAGIRQSTAGDLFSIGATLYHAAEGEGLTASSTGPALPAAPAAPVAPVAPVAPAAEKLLVDTGLSAGVRPTSRPR